MRSKKSAPFFKNLEKTSSGFAKKLNLRLKKIPHAKGVIGAAVVGTVLVCVAAAALIVAARQPSESMDADATRDVEVSQQIAVATPSQPAAQTKAPVAAPPRKPTAAKPAAPDAATADAPAGDAPGANTAAGTTATAGIVAPVSAQVQESEAVTLTGCLVRDDEMFRLKDPIGAEAPKSRSWKSGFLRKRPASVDIIDPANSLRLTNYIGERVTVTGLLDDREMRVRSLRPASGSCS